MAGLNTAFSTGSKHKLANGSVIQTAGAVHLNIHPSGQPSVSTQIAALRRLLLEPIAGELGAWFDKIRKVNFSVYRPFILPGLTLALLDREKSR